MIELGDHRAQRRVGAASFQRRNYFGRSVPCRSLGGFSGAVFRPARHLGVVVGGLRAADRHLEVRDGDLGAVARGFGFGARLRRLRDHPQLLAKMLGLVGPIFRGRRMGGTDARRGFRDGKLTKRRHQQIGLVHRFRSLSCAPDSSSSC
ncbi:hypothetical protein [Rhodopseudomonas palustris]|uniref:hypothetical protein n=1 Tax=Rhodopseudomonas palustris TaxID=1076 RepID=UPI0039F506AC